MATEVPGWLIALVTAVVSFAVTWGSTRATVVGLRDEIRDLREAVKSLTVTLTDVRLKQTELETRFEERSDCCEHCPEERVA